MEYRRSQASVPMIIALVMVFVAATSFGQRPANDCPDLKITAPDYSSPWDTVPMSATSAGVAIKGDWLLVKHNFDSRSLKVEQVKDQASIEATAWQTNDSGSITAVVRIPATAECSTERSVAVLVSIIENPGSPMIIDEFGILPPRDQKARLDAVAVYMRDRPDDELLISLRFPRSETGARRSKVMDDLIGHLSVLRKFPLDRITFLVEEAEGEFSAQFQSVPQETVPVIAAMYLEIKAEKLAQYRRLFR